MGGTCGGRVMASTDAISRIALDIAPFLSIPVKN